MTGAQRYNARMERIMDECRDAKTRFNASSRTEDTTPAPAPRIEAAQFPPSGDDTRPEAPRIEVEATARPLPWRIKHPDRGRVKFTVIDAGYFPVASFDTEDEAGRVVQAVNSHQALVDALQALIDTETNPNGVSGIALLDAIDKARAALKLAGE